jgi:ssDNA-binding Zn-finger/Zn-ribbon topoisomerase 1
MNTITAMTLHFIKPKAITNRDSTSFWCCSKCESPLVIIDGKFYWTCNCYKDNQDVNEHIQNLSLNES